MLCPMKPNIIFFRSEMCIIRLNMEHIRGVFSLFETRHHDNLFSVNNVRINDKITATIIA